MTRDFVLQLRYVGVFPQTGYREYRFRIEKEAAEVRNVVLTIEDDQFGTNGLLFQEAPDLCYQRLLMDLRNETTETPLLSRATVTAVDIDSYRESHPAGKARKTSSRSHA